MPIVAHPQGQEIPWRPESDRFILEYVPGVRLADARSLDGGGMTNNPEHRPIRIIDARNLSPSLG